MATALISPSICSTPRSCATRFFITSLPSTCEKDCAMPVAALRLEYTDEELPRVNTTKVVRV